MENIETQAADLAAELAKAKQELAAANAALKQSGAPAPLTGSYKGFSFQAGHRRVRNQQGELCDTQKLLDAAAAGDATAIEILDWLIKIKYGYLVAVDDTAQFPPDAPKAPKKPK